LGERLGGGLALTVVGGLELRRGDVGVVVGDLAVEPAMVEPVDVAEGGELDVVESLPRCLRVDELPFVEAVEASAMALS
jgi:hypothetical protein